MSAGPLAGRRILVTRAPHQASELADRLQALGATPILMPTIEIVPPSSFAGLDAAVAALTGYDLVAFTSANSVAALRQRAEALAIRPAPQRIAVVGPATQRALEAAGLQADVVPPVFTAESLLETLRPEVSGRRVLLVLAEDAPAALRDGLAAAGASVTVAAAYRNRVPPQSVEQARLLFGGVDGDVDTVTFTSASTATNLVALLGTAGITLPSQVMRASIGPVTSQALRELDLPPHVEAREATIAALIDAIARHFRACDDQSCIAPPC